MVTDTSVEELSGTSAPSTPPTPPTPPTTPPRITNEKVGSRKQKDSARKLSEYSREASKKKGAPRGSPGASKDTEGAKGTEGTEGAEGTTEGTGGVKDDSDEVSDTPKSTISTGNIIAALGVGVAALCLYLSYRTPTPRPNTTYAPTADRTIPQTIPQTTPQTIPQTTPQPPSQTPRFKRL